MKVTIDRVYELTLRQLLGFAGFSISLIIAGTSYTVNLQHKIYQKLDNGVTHREFEDWQEQLQKENKLLIIPNMKKFRGDTFNIIPDAPKHTAIY